MAVFFTSDTHFGHQAIIHLKKRGFASASEMDESLIANWNAVVGPGDTVYHLGDFSYRNTRSGADYLDALNGTIHLIEGNHDQEMLKQDAARFASISQISVIEPHGQLIVLCHYPMREWDRAWRGSWHLFGHVHGRLDSEPLGYSLDVGVDSHDFRPWSFGEIAELFATRDNPFTDRR
ncbi:MULTISPECIES: metallophosphoesterase family protein [Rhodomicrobium]|uniref:metallophosphoesterase family protein n=1 Tax=Rhodomicrobium TaxID=1068 RepID=UPI000B4B30E7|nr:MULTISPECIES: metallophosphoesterase family protein [Rhodomicrobium]